MYTIAAKGGNGLVHFCHARIKSHMDGKAKEEKVCLQSRSRWQAELAERRY